MNFEVIHHTYSEISPPIQVEVRRSARAKRYILKRKVASANFVLTIPKRGSRMEAFSFLRRSSGWIEAQLQKSTVKVELADGAIIPIAGVPHIVAHRPQARGVVWVEQQDGKAPLLCVAGHECHMQRRVVDYVKKQALLAYTHAVETHTRNLGKPHSKIRLNDPKTRWGSCSPSGVLSFSWRMVMAPPSVLHYLAAHEVAHLQHMDHSAAFWRTVAHLDPHWKTAEHWLKKEASKLHSIV